MGNGAWVHPEYKQDQSPQPSCLWPGNLPVLACSQLELQESLDSSCTLPHLQAAICAPPFSYPWSTPYFFWWVQVPLPPGSSPGFSPSSAVKLPSGLSNTLRSPPSRLSPCIVGTCFLGGLGFPMVLAHSRYWIVDNQRWKSPQGSSGPMPSLTGRKPREGGVCSGSHSMSWQKWDQTRCPRQALISHPCLLCLSTSFKSVYFLTFTKIINDYCRKFRKQKEENKNHSEIIINILGGFFGFSTSFWPRHKFFFFFLPKICIQFYTCFPLSQSIW